MITPFLLYFIIGMFIGSGFGIIAAARPEKRKKYMIKAFAFYIGLFTGWFGFFFGDMLYAHFLRRRAFKQWKISKIFPQGKMFP